MQSGGTWQLMQMGKMDRVMTTKLNRGYVNNIGLIRRKDNIESLSVKVEERCIISDISIFSMTILHLSVLSSLILFRNFPFWKKKAKRIALLSYQACDFLVILD